MTKFRVNVYRCLVVLLACYGLFSALHAATLNPEKTLDKLQAQLQRGDLTPEAITSLQVAAASLRASARDASRIARDEALALRDLLEALGPEPAADEPQESREIKQRRNDLNHALGRFDSEVKQAELIVKRADAFITKLESMERERITTGYLARPNPVYGVTVWHNAAAQLVSGFKRVSTKTGERQTSAVFAAVAIVVLLASVGIAIGALSRRLLGRYSRDFSIPAPSYARRSIAAVSVAVSRGLLPVLVFVGLIGSAWAYFLEPLKLHGGTAPTPIFGAVVIYLLGSALVRAAFAPSMPQWRLMPISPQSSAEVGRRLHWLLAVIALDVVITFIFESIGATPESAPELAAAHTFFVTLIVSTLLLALCIPRLWLVEQAARGGGSASDADAKNWLWPLARALLVVASVAMLAASFLGYRLLAEFLRQATISTLIVTAVILGLHVLLSESLNLLLARDSGPAASVKRLLALSESGAHALNFWLTIFVDLGLLIVGVAAVLVFWGIPLSDMWEHVKRLGEGVQLGSYSFSLVDAAIAVLVFVVILGSTRLLQRFFERLLPQTRLDIGVRTAVGAAIGYVGTTIAVLSAISTMGIDLSKLALIAGALSVGIGFGLQNIVNNFVSGLILLIERPVKIGDWVIIGSVEGKIKQINVRSTLIETFKRADVIIPNADLLQTALVNLTHKDRFGRIEVKVGVAYSSDIEQVEKILLHCAAKHAKVLRWPEPQVLFMDFGASSLDFELRVHLANVEEQLIVGSDLRKSIVRAFREAGIEIPFPQTDVWMRAPSAGDGDQA